MSLLLYFAFFLAICFAIAFLILRTISPNPRLPTENEKYYSDPSTKKRLKFPTITDPDGKASCYLSIVIPAYNERERLPLMMEETITHLNNLKSKSKTFNFEVILVNDGSKDNTVEIATNFAVKNKIQNFKLLNLEKNRGKGGAVTQGILFSSGERILFVDADGATRFSDFDKLDEELTRITKDGKAIAVGSRAHMVKSDAVVKRSAIRNFLMHGFHTLLSILGIYGIKDTQCGFKLMTREAAILVFPNMHVEGWIFDIEMLILANQHKIPIVEVPVNWHEVDGSKVDLLKDSIKMLLDLLNIRLNYLLGIWKVNKISQKKAKSD